MNPITFSNDYHEDMLAIAIVSTLGTAGLLAIGSIVSAVMFVVFTAALALARVHYGLDRHGNLSPNVTFPMT